MATSCSGRARATRARRAAPRAAAREVGVQTGHDPNHSALLVEVLGAEDLVGSWRQEFDPVARFGVPAHVTVLFPFRAPEQLNNDTLDAVSEVARSVQPFQVAFNEPASWPGVVWLRPEPDDGFRALTNVAAARFPDCRPYGGAYDDVVPHLTVGQNLDEHQHARALREMTDGLKAHPVELTVREISLYASDAEGEWSRQHAWPLG